MACNITITDAIGAGQPLNAITVFGIAKECAEDPIKKTVSVKIGISCVSIDGPYQDMIVPVAEDGSWTAVFNNPGRCLCDSEIFVTAVCHNDPNCEAEPIQKRLNCVICPIVSFSSGDDDVGQPQSIICDSDGTVLINIHFQIFNPSANPIVASVNCGPGGTEVVGGTFPIPGGTSIFDNSVICRYDPTVTPNPAPFIEFFNPVDNSPLGCPPVLIPIGALPDCGNACPTMVVLEVRDSSDTIIDPDGVQCLVPGDYKVRVIVPAFVPGMFFSWSDENGTSLPGNLQEIIVSVPPNEEVERLVSVFTSVECLPTPSNHVTLKGCADNCDQDLTIEVRNSLGELINPSDCVDADTYTVIVTSPTGSNWTFAWAINGVQDNMTNASQYEQIVNSGDSFTISVTAEADGCQNKTVEITLNSCGNGGGGGGGGIFSCNGLLIAAITLIISGGILGIIGVCTSFLPLMIAGAISAAVGLILLTLWAVFCKKFTSCSVLNKLRCLLNWMALIAAIIGAIGAIAASVTCGLTAIATGASWALIAQLLTDVMVKKNCMITSCFLP